MRILLLSCMITLFASGVFASDFQITGKLYRIDTQWIGSEPQRLYLYDVCGSVTSETGRSVSAIDVTVTADYDSSREGNYSAKTNANGKFCVIIRSFGGRARVSVNGAESEALTL